MEIRYQIPDVERAASISRRVHTKFPGDLNGGNRVDSGQRDERRVYVRPEVDTELAKCGNRDEEQTC